MATVTSIDRMRPTLAVLPGGLSEEAMRDRYAIAANALNDLDLPKDDPLFDAVVILAGRLALRTGRVA